MVEGGGLVMDLAGARLLAATAHCPEPSSQLTGLTSRGASTEHRLPTLIIPVVVGFSVWEIIGQSDGGLSVLRTFRLLRVLKLVRFLPALRRQLVVLMKTMDNVATFCMLLMLFIFTFRYEHHRNKEQPSLLTFKGVIISFLSTSILGMHLFGCKFSFRTESGDTIPDRKNFDSLLWAIVTVFQVGFPGNKLTLFSFSSHPFTRRLFPGRL